MLSGLKITLKTATILFNSLKTSEESLLVVVHYRVLNIGEAGCKKCVLAWFHYRENRKRRLLNSTAECSNIFLLLI